MIAWLRQHRRALGAAGRKLVAQKSAGLLSVLVMGIALALPAGGYVLLDNLRAAAGRFSFEPRLTLFLAPAAKRAEADALAATLKGDRRLATVRFVPREEALAELKSTEGLAEVVAALERNPLPDAFVVSSRDTSPAALDALAADLGKLPQVAHVQADANWARRLAALAAIGRTGLFLLAALLGVGLVAVTFNTIRLQMLTQRDEIEVSKLIGATDAFIRRPFHYLGLLQGLCGGLVALAIVWISVAVLDGEVRKLASLYGSGFSLHFLPPADAGALLAFAALLGWLGAVLSVSIHLREIEPS